MIISGANDYEVYCSFNMLEQVNTRLDNLTRNCYVKLLQPNDCLHKLLPRRELEHNQKLRTFKNFDVGYSAVLVAFKKTIFCHNMLFVTTDY